jgi:hypothetical protein
MENFFKKLLVAIILISATALNAAYLKDVPQTITQPDGTKLECFATGDEFYARLHDADGYTIIQNTQGVYVYANKVGNELVPTNLVFGQHNPQSLGLEKGISISHSAYMELRRPFDEEHQAWFQERETRLKKQGDQFQAQPRTVNNIVIFIDFANSSFTTTNLAGYETDFNTGPLSMKSYFSEVSYSNCTVQSHFYPAPANNIIVRFKSVRNREYLLPQSTQNPGGYTNNTDRNNREVEMIRDAVAAIAFPSNLNVDTDNDGFVDAITIYFPGNAVSGTAL